MSDELQYACVDCGHLQDNMERLCDLCGSVHVVALEFIVELLGPNWRTKLVDDGQPLSPEELSPEEQTQFAQHVEPYPLLRQLELVLNSHARLRRFRETTSIEVIIENELSHREKLLDTFLAMFPTNTSPTGRISAQDIVTALRFEMSFENNRGVH